MIGEIFGLRILASHLRVLWILFDSFFLLHICNPPSDHLDLLLLFLAPCSLTFVLEFHFCSISVPFDTPDQVTSGPYTR